jgi:hypothetical protein
MEQTRKLATERAVVIYKNGDIGLSSMFGDNALDSARRAHLVDDANAGGDAAIAQLTVAVSTSARGPSGAQRPGCIGRRAG